MYMDRLHYNNLNNKTVKDLSCLSKARRKNKINEEDTIYTKECNYKLFFFIVQLQQKLRDVEKENEKLKHLLKKYNRDAIYHDNEMTKRVLLITSCLIFIIIFFLF
ncbi:conserved Plasmodium protein, unknown function [Plasmodium malariae]|uniref:Uncharacterized protein n=1 Tax=Plasmodium malariae TaxID=5858 RepID=A0A1D3SQ78_PLAMA|nr:conserved Plasmodium protein, unknown function [Plasmodium malariae]SCO93644.1 conserved Plasmodium protein, unknown function [Plasmodium malariae]